jgi:hypothetical protein
MGRTGRRVRMPSLREPRCDHTGGVVSRRRLPQTLEVGVTESHQNAAAATGAMTPRSRRERQTVINVAGGKVCHAELRVCGEPTPRSATARSVARLSARPEAGEGPTLRRLGTRAKRALSSLRHGSDLPAENAHDRRRDPAPLGFFLCKLLPSSTRQAVEPRPTVVIRCSPFRRDEAAFLQALQRRVQRAVIDDQHLVRLALDVAGNALAVSRSER